jgi:hypothetical protein
VKVFVGNLNVLSKSRLSTFEYAKRQRGWGSQRLHFKHEHKLFLASARLVWVVCRCCVASETMEAPTKPGRPADDGEGRKVFVGGIPFGVEKRDIQEDFSKFGPIEDVYLPMDRETRKPRGFGFVTFVDARDANEAVSAMHGCAHRFSHRGPSARATCYSH